VTDFKEAIKACAEKLEREEEEEAEQRRLEAARQRGQQMDGSGAGAATPQNEKEQTAKPRLGDVGAQAIARKLQLENKRRYTWKDLSNGAIEGIEDYEHELEKTLRYNRGRDKFNLPIAQETGKIYIEHIILALRGKFGPDEAEEQREVSVEKVMGNFCPLDDPYIHGNEYALKVYGFKAKRGQRVMAGLYSPRKGSHEIYRVLTTETFYGQTMDIIGMELLLYSGPEKSIDSLVCSREKMINNGNGEWTFVWAILDPNTSYMKKDKTIVPETACETFEFGEDFGKMYRYGQVVVLIDEIHKEQKYAGELTTALALLTQRAN